jgi:nitrogen fixation NifU-like protein
MTAYTFTDYGPVVLDHFEHPRNVGRVEDPDAIGRAGNPACGDQVELSLRIRQDRIEEARFRASGCSAAIASSSITTVLLTGMTLEEAAALTDATVAGALGGLPPAKLHCSVLAEDAVAAALEDYARRKGGAPE